MHECPKCRSRNIRSNKFDQATLTKVSDATQAARTIVHPGFAFIGVSIWSGMQAFNAFRHDWCCNACGNRFS